MMKHTKGPWNLRREQTTADTSHWFVTAHSQGDYERPVDICEVFPICDDGQIGGESHANATLLQSAPDMLTTLRAIANDCEDYLNDDLDMDAGELCQAFLAAINKVHDQATGSTFSSENPVDEYGEKV